MFRNWSYWKYANEMMFGTLRLSLFSSMTSYPVHFP